MPELDKPLALLSVSDKKGIGSFAKRLVDSGYGLVSTGGTRSKLEGEGLSVLGPEDLTGFPESFDGRVKTLSSQISAGILFDRQNPSHVQQARDLGIRPIDIVVCNLYPFEETLRAGGATQAEMIEKIDIGGPTMIRGGAKNFASVLVVVDPQDYDEVGDRITQGTVDRALRMRLAAKAIGHTAFYDANISDYLRSEAGIDFPDELVIPGRRLRDLRYGENPHQTRASVYDIPIMNSPLRNIVKLAGSDQSMTNFTDINAGIEAVRLFREPAAVVIKHNTPAGIATGRFAHVALERSIDADPKSAFGGVVVTNRHFDMKSAAQIARFKENKGLMDVIAAPSFDPEAVELISKLRKNNKTGVFAFGDIPEPNSHQLKFVDGGFVMQDADLNIDASFADWKVVTEKQPTEAQVRQAEFAWKALSRVRSNTIVVVGEKIPMTRGIGSGQTSRVDATQIALKQAAEAVLRRAGGYAKNGIMVSDSFFPFEDSVELAAKYGISLIVQQGSSLKDQLSTDAANKNGIAMIHTGRRAFWH